MSTSTVTRSNRSATPARIPAQRTAPAGARPMASGPRPSQGSVRLTRRGRVVVTLLFLGLLLGAFVIFGDQSVATGEAGAPVPTRTIIVGEGDTLWGIAGEVADEGDIREVVHEIQQLNSLPGPVLEVGQEIAVPIG